MKVQYKGNGKKSESGVTGSGSLCEGDEYVVLAISCTRGSVVYYRIEERRKDGPAIYDADLFVVVDGNIPKLWTVDADQQGNVTISPPAWQAPRFWGYYYDNHPEAVRLYERDRDLLMRYGS